MPNPTSGVLNPYALAEIVLNRRVDWANTPNALQVMADALGTPANELFDPQYKSITYAFREPAADGGLQTRTLASMAQAKKMTAADLTTKAKANPESVLQMLDIAHAASMSPATQLQLGKLINGIIFLPPDLRTWTPAGATWVQEGEFFDHGTQYSDPQQGALGDCWLISTLASIAWTRPTAIVDCNRPTGTGAQDFLNQITFCPSGTMQISEKVPMGGSSGSYYYMFARGLDGHETWPAIYEKAFAKWKSGNLTDEPPYDTLNGNSPIYACQSLLGLAGIKRSCQRSFHAPFRRLTAVVAFNQNTPNVPRPGWLLLANSMLFTAACLFAGGVSLSSFFEWRYCTSGVLIGFGLPAPRAGRLQYAAIFRGSASSAAWLVLPAVGRRRGLVGRGVEGVRDLAFFGVWLALTGAGAIYWCRHLSAAKEKP